MNILYINHKKSQCGVYEIGKRIYKLIDKNILPMAYYEIDNANEYFDIINFNKPDVVIYNYVYQTLQFLTPDITKSYPQIKHIAIIHDSFNYMDYVEEMFDCWIAHDPTNTFPSNKKFLTVRPIPRFIRKNESDSENISIGSHGFSISPWKMYDTMVEFINYAFDNAIINFNLPVATFGGTIEQTNAIVYLCKLKITKPGIILNITHDYFETEEDLIENLSKNTMNMYFYDDTVYTNMGIAGSADLAIASQSSLAVNSAYMYRHINTRLGSCTKDNIHEFIHNSKKVKELYEEWSPERITNDYKKIIET